MYEQGFVNVIRIQGNLYLNILVVYIAFLRNV